VARDAPVRTSCAAGRSQPGAVRTASGNADSLRISLQTEGKEAAAREGPSAGNCGSKGGSEEAGSLPTTDRVAGLMDLGDSLRKTRSRGLGARFALRGWGGLLGAGLAVAIGFFGVSVAMRGVAGASKCASIDREMHAVSQGAAGSASVERRPGGGFGPFDYSAIASYTERARSARVRSLRASYAR